MMRTAHVRALAGVLLVAAILGRDLRHHAARPFATSAGLASQGECFGPLLLEGHIAILPRLPEGGHRRAPTEG